ncbi:MAG TPA: hypothetical protein ENJ56_00365 [Anaerolineae bacterium]|nr:hypothetical protein [Anaerolineae bacterium]
MSSVLTKAVLISLVPAMVLVIIVVQLTNKILSIIDPLEPSFAIAAPGIARVMGSAIIGIVISSAITSIFVGLSIAILGRDFNVKFWHSIVGCFLVNMLSVLLLDIIIAKQISSTIFVAVVWIIPSLLLACLGIVGHLIGYYAVGRKKEA